MGNTFEKGWRVQVIFYSMIGMLCCLFVTRAGLSIAMMLFIATATVHKKIIQQFVAFVQSPLLVGISLLFLIPFISGLWSTDVQEWTDQMRIKLPLLLMPIAFAGNWQLSSKQWRFIGFLFLLLLFISTCWSLLQYLQNSQHINASYLKAKTIPTPLQNDHVRYSWLVCVGILLSFLLYKSAITAVRIMLAIVAVWFLIYLHLLAARTGLFSFYITLLLYLVWKATTSRSKKIVLLTAMVLVLLPLLAWLTLPTFQNRVKYFVYDYSYIKSGAYLPGANDGGRTLSLQAGWHILQQHPGGVGSGDVYNEANVWYTKNISNIQPTDRLYPSSEWLLYGDAAGWIGFVLFTAIMLVPFFMRPAAHNFFWIALNATAAFTFMFDIGLEVQYGVFLYAFVVLWWWKWLPIKNEAAHEGSILGGGNL